MISQLDSIQESPKPSEPDTDLFSPSIRIILSQLCNFACTYCFAQEARSKDRISIASLKRILDDWYGHLQKNRKITFIGGGEPTVTWDELSWAIEYAKSIDSRTNILIVTNGSLLPDERLAFLEKHNVSLSLSFDILPDIQNSQRPIHNSRISSFDVVDSLIKRLACYQIPCGIRSTITSNNVLRMKEMVQFVDANYPHIKKVHLEHVTDTNNPESFYRDFVDNFFDAREYGRGVGINVYNSLTSSQGQIRYSFCSGTKCFVPSSDNGYAFTACHRVSSPKDSLFEIFGTTQQELSSKKRVNESYRHYRGRRELCKECEAKWQCAGGCIMESISLPSSLLLLKCKMVREFNKRLLLEKLST